MIVELLCVFACLGAGAGDEAGEDTTFDCDTTFYADVQGLSIRCYPFPMFESKHIPCFKDLWWKYLVYSLWGQSVILNSNPFNILDSDSCQKKCRCVIEFSFDLFGCMSRGRPPTWSKSLQVHQRTASYCRGLTLPQEIKENSDLITLGASFLGLYTTADDNVLLGDVALALNDFGIESIEVVSLRKMTQAALEMTAMDNFFQAGRFQNLVFLNLGGDQFAQNFTWPTMGSALPKMPSKILFFTLNDFNVSSIPKPPFADKLRVLTCVRCWGLIEAPKWIIDSKQLVFLHLSSTPANFRLADLPPSQSLLHFAFSDCPFKKLPDTFNLSLLYPNLENLDLSNLEITVVPPGIVQGLKNLRRLDLSGNNLSPLPSFAGLSNLIYLNMDGIAAIYGTNNNKPTDLYGSLVMTKPLYMSISKTMTLKRSDLKDLVNLEILSVSAYQNLLIDDDAFIDLRKLSAFAMSAIPNMTRFPTALRYTCGLKKIGATTSAFGGLTESADPNTWLIPLFIPKFYKNLQVLDISFSTLPTIPTSMLVFTTPKDSPLMQMTTDILRNTPKWSGSPCEMYKFEQAYKYQSTATKDFINTSATSCIQSFLERKTAALKAMENMTDYCLKSGSTRGNLDLVSISFSLSAAAIALW